MKFYFLCVTMLIINSYSFSQNNLSSRELKEDFYQFKRQLFKRNKGLFLFIDEAEYNTYLDSLEKELNKEMSPIAFYQLLKEAIVPVEERHLSIDSFHRKSEISKQLNNKKAATRKIFPLVIFFNNDTTAYILRNANRDSTIQLPSRLLAINDENITDIRQKIASSITQDHGVDTWRNWEISKSFPVKYYFAIDTTSLFTIRWKDSLNNTIQTEINGISRKAYVDSINKQSKKIYGIDKFLPPMRYHLYDSLNIGYLKIGSFSENKIKFEGEVIKYKKVVKEFFEEVRDNNYNKIIIDLRNNTGGSVSLLKYLLAYIQPNEDKELMYTQFKNRNYWWGDVNREKTTSKQRQPNFNGQIYILTNGGSYSASVMFAVYAKKFADAKIIGLPAGGRPTGTSAGSFHVERLKNSDILVRIPETVFNYTDEEEISIIPDVYVQPNISDFFDYESDNQLEKALEFISNE